MDRFPPLLFILLLAAASASSSANHVDLPAKLYWHTVLPNSPMPSSIQNLLHPDGLVDEKAGTSVGVGKGGVNVNTGKGKPGGTTVNVGHKGVGVNVQHGQGGTHVGVGKGGVNVNTGKGKPGGTTVNVGHKGVGVNVQHGQGGTHVGVGGGGVHVGTGKGKPGGGGTNVHVGHGGVNVNTGHKGKPVVVNVGPTKSPFFYKYAATDTQIHDDPRVSLFFLEKELHPGAKMTLHFTTTPVGAAFLPRRAADSIPFSSKKVPEILEHFSVEPSSVDAEAIKKTLQECEEPAANGERKYCATSLESMVEFSMSSLGTRDIRAVSTTVGREGTPEQQYTVASSGVRRMAGSKSVACHTEPYAYAVFYCHSARAARAYTVEMVGKDETKVEAVAVCHTDTSGWNPKHVAFRVLKVRPGTVPICHFLPQDHVVWAPSK